MTIAQKLETIANNEDRVYDAGYDRGYYRGERDGEQNGYAKGYDDRINDVFKIITSEGTSKSYFYAFANNRFTNANFSTKYPFKSTHCGHMFYNSSISVTNATFGTSECSNFSDMFNNAWGVTEIPALDMARCTVSEFCFATSNITKITNINVSENTVFDTASPTFYSMSNVTEIRFTGALACSVYFRSMTKASKDSVKSIIGCLSTSAVGTTCSIPKACIDTAFASDSTIGSETSEWNSLKATKPNWTIALI